MYKIQLYSEIGGRWVDSVNPRFMGNMELDVAKQRVAEVQVCAWQIVNKHGKAVKSSKGGR